MMGLQARQQQQSVTKEVLLFNDDFAGKESAENYLIEKSNKDTNAVEFRDGPVSYTHLDVYKRQQHHHVVHHSCVRLAKCFLFVSQILLFRS